MKIATLGTGGIGGFLAVKLIQAEHQVATIARGAHLAAIQQHGLRLISPDGPITAYPHIASDNPSEIGAVDVVIFGVKGDGLDHAAELCRPLLGPNTLVVPFLNGVEAATRLAQILPTQHIGNGVAKVSTTVSAPGEITQTGDFSEFVFAERDTQPSARVAALQSALIQAGVSAPECINIDTEIWSKFIFFSALSGITAASRCPIGAVQTTPALSNLFRTTMAETARVGRAMGVAIPKDTEETLWALTKSLPPGLRASTAIDLNRGLPIEVECVSGAVVRLARAQGVDVPVNAALYALLLPYRFGDT